MTAKQGLGVTGQHSAGINLSMSEGEHPVSAVVERLHEVIKNLEMLARRGFTLQYNPMAGLGSRLKDGESSWFRMDPNPNLDMSIEDIGLKTFTRNVLHMNAGVRTVDLNNWTMPRLLRQKSFGPGCKKDLQAALKRLGLEYLLDQYYETAR